MNKKTLFLCCLIYCSWSQAATYELTLSSKQTVSLNNSFGKTFSAQCTINASSMFTNSLAIYMQSGSITFNGTSVKAGQKANEIVYNNQYIPITVYTNASGQLTNTGTQPVKLLCNYKLN